MSTHKDIQTESFRLVINYPLLRQEAAKQYNILLCLAEPTELYINHWSWVWPVCTYSNWSL